MPANASELGSGNCTAVLESPRREPEGLTAIVSRTQIVWIGGRLTVEPELELIKVKDHVGIAVPESNAASVSKMSLVISVVVPVEFTSSDMDSKELLVFVIRSL
jgi:hypothetical protein